MIAAPSRSLIIGGVMAIICGVASEETIIRNVGPSESVSVLGGCTWTDNQNCPNYNYTGCSTEVCTGTSPQGPTCTVASNPDNTVDATWENACTTGYSAGLTDCGPPGNPQCGVTDVCNVGPFCVNRFGIDWCTTSHTTSSGYSEDQPSGDFCTQSGG
jgi:hypothetical protein